MREKIDLKRQVTRSLVKALDLSMLHCSLVVTDAEKISQVGWKYPNPFRTIKWRKEKSSPKWRLLDLRTRGSQPNQTKTNQTKPEHRLLATWRFPTSASFCAGTWNPSPKSHCLPHRDVTFESRSGNDQVSKKWSFFGSFFCGNFRKARETSRFYHFHI